MNLLDLAILAVFVFFVLSGVYRGFLPTLLSIAAYILSWLLALIFLPAGAKAITANQSLYNQMLYYTEGSEYVGDVELAKTDISNIGAAELAEILDSADLPYPMAKQINRNMAKEAFAGEGVTTLGDYFNQTIVRVFISIISFLCFFALFRALMSFLINGVDYAWKFPRLRAGDQLLAGGLGLIRGILAVFLLFMLLPLVLIVLAGKLAFVTELVDGSLFSNFFYRSNFLLSMMPGT
ncbi:MAG TPA: CvpA family protein [Clostridia bacterium]|nr:CvpA family protein [Clostridia bacterium]